MSSGQGEVALRLPQECLHADPASRGQWIKQRIWSFGRRRRMEVVGNGPPSVRDTQVVIGGTSVWTGGRHTR